MNVNVSVPQDPSLGFSSGNHFVDATKTQHGSQEKLFYTQTGSTQDQGLSFQDFNTQTSEFDFRGEYGDHTQAASQGASFFQSTERFYFPTLE